MADEEPRQPQSIAQRIAALKLNQGSPVPNNSPPSYTQATNNANATGSARPRPPPPPRPSLPARPSAHGRTASTNLPTQNGSGPVVGQANGDGGLGIGNLPEEGEVKIEEARPALPPRTSTQSSLASPALPPRRPSESPALPARRPSAAPSTSSAPGSRRPSNYSLSRRESNESMSSLATTRSGTSQSDRYAVKAPAFDLASLPPLPPKRTQEEREADAKKYQGVGGLGLKGRKSMPGMAGKSVGTTPPPPSVPARPTARPAPALPRRESVEPPPALPKRNSTAEVETGVKSPPLTPARGTVAPPPRKSALTMGFGGGASAVPPIPGRPTSVPQADGAGGPAPPPVPKDSRPDLAALQASKPKPNGMNAARPPAAAPTSTATSCLHCRDFSAPDTHAARFPRESLPSQDLAWLAHQLTAPFPSHTDKARALFTWLHHNIAYDTVAFFAHNVKPSTPTSTLATGLAVCEGYAGLFAALAMKCGLEAIVVGGNGKGFGHRELQPGEPIPPYNAGHAWNAVRIDTGQWKLIDCCWGAGSVNGANQPYQKRFSPERFTQSNDEFGLDHYPEDPAKQFRSDGRVMRWEEYITGHKNGCGADFFAGFVAEEGLDKTTFLPHEGKISLSGCPGPTVRFAFQKVCPHWDPVRNGRGPRYLYVLALDGLEGTRRNHVPFESDGSVWWCDVAVGDLGRAGGTAQVYTVTSFDGRDGRGLALREYRERKGRVGMGFGGVCRWEVVA